MMRKLTAFFLMLLLIFSMAVSASAAETGYVFDDAGLLTSNEKLKLTIEAQSIAEEYGCGVYIVTVEDYRAYGYASDVYDVTWGIYHDMELGVGKERNGLILLLSMEDRDYATFVYGKVADYAFSDHALIKLENQFLDDFGNDDWYEGFDDYLTVSRDYLHRAAQGRPVRESPVPMILIFLLLACIIAFIITGIFWSQMRNVKMQSSARAYASGQGLNLTVKLDNFTHQTVSRRKIDTSSSSGSRSRSGGGGHGRSGKF